MQIDSDDCRFTTTIFESYAAACGCESTTLGVADAGDASFTEGLERVKEHLQGLQGDAAACLICLETISASDPIWHCYQGCHEMVHLVCIQSWARQQLAAQQAKAEARLNPDRFPAAAAEARGKACWGCPKCRQEYPGADIPSGYFCFCGKTADPPFDPWNAPHSCGERCERPSSGCGHPCMLLCHPGPCPPCPRMVTASCHCGRHTSEKRCGRHLYSCGGGCGQRLPCGHACPETCHQGECPPCQLLSTVSCRCGAASRQLPCSQAGLFQCGKVCGLPLDCGRHTCEEMCHTGPCGPCKLAGEKRCPCGKQLVPGAPCDLVVPPCGATCDKLLPCGLHRCIERCHTGPCPQTCRGQVEKTCACGKTTKVVQCHEAVRCERRCTAVRSCGRHPCKRRCCSGECPPCEEVCGRRLRCGNHRCPAPCHPGPCPPCPLAARIACACGRTSYPVPCGRERVAPPPRCTHPCPVKPLCRHADSPDESCQLALRHPCHFGPCPGSNSGRKILCPHPCGTPHPSCGHPCQSPSCHDPLPPPVSDYQPPPAPTQRQLDVNGGGGGGGGDESKGSTSSVGSRNSSKKKKQRGPDEHLPVAYQAAQAAASLAATLPRQQGGHLSACPPCQVPVAVTCLGGHQTVELPCSAAGPFSCAARCGRPLPCGNHTCPLPCHDPSASGCQECSARCTKLRCEHPCQLGCHPGDCPRCELGVTRPCHCGKTSLRFHCWEVTQEGGLDQGRLRCEKTCYRALPHCPHLCTDLCHPGPCPAGDSCGEEVAVKCGCKRVKRKIPCTQVQALLMSRTGSGDYHANTSMRLLPCDAECAALAAAEAASKAGKAAARGGASDDQANSVSGPDGTQQAQRAADQGSQHSKKGKKEERQEREEERRRRQQLKERQARRAIVVKGLGLALAVLLATLMGLAIHRLLRLADQKAQEAWGVGSLEEL